MLNPLNFITKFIKSSNQKELDRIKKIKNLIRTRYKLKKIKVGHAGTLDPLATGLLIVCTGKFTKRIPEIQGQEKTYTGSITLGGSTPSYDLETKIDAAKGVVIHHH